MLLRETGDGWLAVTQPAHAWLSAQLAAAWDAVWAAPVEPREGVVAGTLLHDIGWLDWEAAPTLNAETGLPHTFLELPIATHIGMWREAAPRALAFGRYPALLTSLHGTRLYGGRDLSRLEAQDAALIAGFLAGERERQRVWIASLAADHATAGSVDDEVLDRNSRYVALWDAMSLAICGGSRSERSFNSPVAGGAAHAVRLLPMPGRDAFALDPWPFADREVCVTFDARAIDRRFEDEQAMRAALAAAPWRSIDVRLAPG